MPRSCPSFKHGPERYHTPAHSCNATTVVDLVLNYFGLSSGRGSAWLERLVRDQEVGGSNPLAPIFFNPTVAAGSRICSIHPVTRK